MIRNYNKEAWFVRVPLSVRDEIEQLARADRRKPSEMMRIILYDALEQRRASTTNNNNKKVA
jgi:hypothetical protein